MGFTPRFVPPPAEDLIADLLAQAQDQDPEDEMGFSSQELWEWRYATYGYDRLMRDWLATFKPTGA